MTTTTAPKIQFPATQAFVQALLAECAKQGLKPVSLDPTTESGLKENGGWAFLRLEGTHEAGASLIIPKAAGRLGKLHSHVDLSAYPGYVALPKKNGKVICHFEPDVAKVSACLKAFLSAAKRATAAPTPKATVAATPSAPAEATPVIDFTMPAGPQSDDSDLDSEETEDGELLQHVAGL